jgi:hypothetical protein
MFTHTGFVLLTRVNHLNCPSIAHLIKQEQHHDIHTRLHVSQTKNIHKAHLQHVLQEVLFLV